MLGLNDKVVKTYQVRNGVTAYKTDCGSIRIENDSIWSNENESYLGYTIKEAIALYRKKYPAFRK